MKEDLPRNDKQNDEYITVSRSLLSSLIVGFVTFMVGSALGYFLALTAFNQDVDDSTVALQGTFTDAGAQVAPQPTPVPARLDNVSVDDDPYIGPEDAPVTIVEFSDFR